MPESRLSRQIAFVLELDKLKQVLRRSHLIGQDRRENSAEHSWHVALVALVLAEYSSEPVDVAHVLRLLLVHDVVEIDAGDTPVYDLAGQSAQTTREVAAAGRIFGLLPPDQAVMCRRWWDEFEAQTTPEAKFAKAVDRLIPFLQNFHNQGRGWQEMAVSAEDIVGVNQPRMVAGAPELWDYVEVLVREAVGRGYVPADGQARGAMHVAADPPVARSVLERLDDVSTPRLALSRMTLEDWHDLARMHADPLVMATLGGVRSASETRAYVERQVDHWAHHHFGWWTVRDRATGEFLGRGGIRRVEIDGRAEVEVGYSFLAGFWGRGLATELGRASVNVAFGLLDLPDLVCFAFVGNSASRRVMEKVGFVHERTALYEGNETAFYRQTRSSWKPHPGAFAIGRP